MTNSLTDLSYAINQFDLKGRRLSAIIRLIAPSINKCREDGYTVQQIYETLNPALTKSGLMPELRTFTNSYYRLKTKPDYDAYIGTAEESNATELVNRLAYLRAAVESNPRNDRQASRYVWVFSNLISLCMEQGYSYEQMREVFVTNDPYLARQLPVNKLSAMVRYRGFQRHVAPIAIPHERLMYLTFDEFDSLVATFPIDGRKTWNYLQWLSPAIFSILIQGYSVAKCHNVINKYAGSNGVSLSTFPAKISRLKAKYRTVYESLVDDMRE